MRGISIFNLQKINHKLLSQRRSSREEAQAKEIMGLARHITAISAAILVVGMVGSVCSSVESAPNTQVVTVLCNSGVYFRGDPFAISLAYVIADLETQTPSRKGYDYRNISPYPNAFAYGRANCNKNITSSDCEKCLVAANTTMISGCGSRIGARAVLLDCSMRYEQYPF
ncbi:antifungal protein ginkbilobin-like protein [Coffea arabica]|uniref:Antifungal protein ginkbilobin-like protein n=1 Tax=Coffea arabica TaxID=13443 RepID=A0ABM4W7G3_COFAR